MVSTNLLTRILFRGKMTILYPALRHTVIALINSNLFAIIGPTTTHFERFTVRNSQEIINYWYKAILKDNLYFILHTMFFHELIFMD
jgi:hypothetical protein